MIFVTVGTQFPFDRLISAVDAWAERHSEQKVIAQVGASIFSPRAIETHMHMSATRFDEIFEAADLIIAHAGMGTILSALDKGKPIVVVPRLRSLGEHRNDHQMDTVAGLKGTSGIFICENINTLGPCIENGLQFSPSASSSSALDEFIVRLRQWVLQ